MACGRTSLVRPLKGVVIGVFAATLSIKLESGRCIEMPQVHDIEKWDAVLVPWDFTTNKPVKVYKPDPDEPTGPVMVEPEQEETVNTHHESLPDEEMTEPDEEWFCDSGFCGSPTVL